MKLASYRSTRPGLQGIANRLIRWRLRGPYSHSEIVFEPGDGVDGLMPDGSCAPDADGALWCVASVAAEHLPAWSARRSGRMGGVRFKRIALSPDRWDIVPLHTSPMRAAVRAGLIEGERYDWPAIAGFLSWLIPSSARSWTCHEACGLLMGIDQPERLDPCSLHRVAVWADTTQVPGAR